MIYSADEVYSDDETSGRFMGCEVCGRYECPGECESPDEPDVDDEPPPDYGPHAGALIVEPVGFEDLPY